MIRDRRVEQDASDGASADRDGAAPGARDPASGRVDVWFLNRGLLIVRPRDPFVEWVLETDPGDGEIDEDVVRHSRTAYLVPEFGSEREGLDWLQSHYDLIFEIELDGWYANPELWPRKRSWAMFRDWFDLETIEMAWDLVDAPLTSEPPAG